MRWIALFVKMMLGLTAALVLLFLLAPVSEARNEVTELLVKNPDAHVTLARVLQADWISPSLFESFAADSFSLEPIARETYLKVKLMVALAFLRFLLLKKMAGLYALFCFATLCEGIIERKKRAEAISAMHPASFLLTLYAVSLLAAATLLLAFLPYEAAFYLCQISLWSLPVLCAGAIALFHRML